MSLESPASNDRYRLAFETFGVPMSLEVDSAELLAHSRAVLPPGWKPCTSVPEEHEFRLATTDGSSYRIQRPGRSLAGSCDLDVALGVLDAEIRAFIAMQAPHHIFVHAGVAALDDRAIVIPGPTFSGKTTLVAELMRAGAVYYSDELAAFNSDGLVEPYPKPLSIRTNGYSQTDYYLDQLGGSIGTTAIPVGWILFTQYRPGASWHPHRLSPGEAVLALLANTAPAQERAEQALSALTRAVNGAVVLEGERGDAGEVLEQLLEGPPSDVPPARATSERWAS